MRKIAKDEAPANLERWKHQNPHGTYDQVGASLRQDIRLACLREQFYLCAYCCKAISADPGGSMNEHLEARKIAPQRSLDFDNIVASCTTSGQCDAAHGSRPLLLTPLMPECETELKFRISGRVEGLSPRAEQAIEVLKLGATEQQNRRLVEARKQLADTLMFVNGIPSDGLDDDELIRAVVDDLETPTDGKLEPYSPVVVNIVRQWLTRP